MRKPRDFDAELKALDNKAKDLRGRRLRQLGDLVIATGADALDPETLAGVLLAAMEITEKKEREGWRERGAAFFLRSARRSASSTGAIAQSGTSSGSTTLPHDPDAGKA